MIRACISLVILGMVSASAYGARGPIPLHPATAWANTYLLNTLFSAELVGYGQYLENAATTPNLEHGKLTQLVTRATFAAQEAKERGQTLVEEAVLAHAMTTVQAKLAGPVEVPKSTAAAVEAVQATFDDPAWQKRFEALAEGYQLGAPSCQLSKDKIQSFVDHQQSLLSKDSAVNSITLLQPLGDFSLGQLRCLVFALMSLSVAHPDKAEFDPLNLLIGLRQTSSPLARDIPIRIMMAIRLLHHHNYAETLRVLLDLRDQDGSYRLAYDLVQNIYSLRQKGQGAVSLRGP